MESFIIFGILLIALFLFSWIKMEKAAEQAEEGYFDESVKSNSNKKSR
ncbi:MAG: hypothetical protein ACR2GN_06225 [Bacteroidia bacterium]